MAEPEPAPSGANESDDWLNSRRIVRVNQRALVTKILSRYSRSWVISDGHFRKTATEYDRKTGTKWLSCTGK
jgi:hypothetical protein